MVKNYGSEHVVFLDGLRGLAALYVVLYHAVVVYSDLLPGVDRLFWPLMQGHYAVTVFIVLSGFCLMLPMVRSGDLQLRGGFRGYLLRRARRILPPYYACLCLAFVLPLLIRFIATGRLSHPFLVPWCKYEGRYDLIAHLTLTHNLWDRFSQDILPPLWSVATEWQIYFVFGLLLLPVLRRWGVIPALALAAVLVLAPFRLLPPAHNLMAACPWMLVAFAIGMAAATLTTLPAKQALLKFALQIGLPCLILFLIPDRMIPNPWAFTFRFDVFASLLTVAIILIAFQQTENSPPWSVKKLLSIRPLVWLGAFSYSLYLTHYLTLVALKVFSPTHSPLTMVRLSLLGGVPLAVVFARLFYQFCEKPFLRPVKTATELPQNPI